jgi:flagellar protein FliO/FliZ
MMSRFLPALAVALSLASGAARAEQPAAAASAAAVPAAAVPAASVRAVAEPAAEPSSAPASAAAPAPAVAAPVAPPAMAAPSPMAGASAGSLLQTIAALCLVLALMAGLAWFLKRYGPKAAAGAAPLRIVGALNLGGRERIMVVEVGDQWIVVGASPGRVNALATLPKQEGVAPAAGLNGALPSATSFSEWLKQTLDKRNAK